MNVNNYRGILYSLNKYHTLVQDLSFGVIPLRATSFCIVSFDGLFHWYKMQRSLSPQTVVTIYTSIIAPFADYVSEDVCTFSSK